MGKLYPAGQGGADAGRYRPDVRADGPAGEADAGAGQPAAPHPAPLPRRQDRRAESSGRDYVSLSLATPEFGPRRLYANLGRVPGEADDRFAIIWNPAN